VTSGINEESQQLQHSTKNPPLLVKLIFQNPLSKLVGNVAKGTADLANNLNPFKYIFPHDVPSTTAKPIATTTTVTTTAQKSTAPTHKDPVGELLLGAKNVFDTVLGGKPQTTALAKPTVPPPAGGHGRGFPAVMFDTGNILQKILEIIGAILHWFDHSEPSYLITRVQSLLQSMESLKDIYLQRDMDGGIGEIPKHVEALLKNFNSLVGSVQNNKPLDLMQLLTAGQSLFQNINKLKDDFIEPVPTTPTPGGLIGNILQGIGGLGNLLNPHHSPKTTTKTNHTSLEKVPGEFGKVVRNTGKLVHTLGEIEEIIQSHNPKNNLLQFIGKIKDLVELCLTNDTLDNEDILDVLQKVWFPNTTLTEIIVNFGKTLQHDFPKFVILQSIGTLLQQKILVDLGLNVCIRSLDFLRFGNIKYSLLQTFANVENIIIGNDLNKLVEGVIDISNNLAGTFEWFLKTFHEFADPLFSNIKHFLKLP
jgi:hypothetical protein